MTASMVGVEYGVRYDGDVTWAYSLVDALESIRQQRSGYPWPDEFQLVARVVGEIEVIRD